MRIYGPLYGVAIIASAFAGGMQGGYAETTAEDPPPNAALLHWKACPDNPVLPPGKPGSWDENIRERMWVIFEDGVFHAWYAGWQGEYGKQRPNLSHLGYATSADGIHWRKYPGNPIFTERWTEDMSVVKDGGIYYMYAEDESQDKTVLHLLTSADKIHWSDQGDVFTKAEGSDWEGGWIGTPLAWKEGAQWYLLYEGGPPGDIGLATSSDGRTWKRDPRNPVLPQGEGWENEVTAPDSIVKIDGVYYLFYHACGERFQAGVAWSRDLAHWNRYEGNPIVPMVSPVIVETPNAWFLYFNNNQINPRDMRLYTSPKPGR